MDTVRCPLGNENGFVLATALWVLLLLVFIGITSVTTSSVEVQVAANDKFHKIAFYDADGGIFSTPKLITNAIETGANPVPPVIDAKLALDVDFYRKVMGFSIAAPTGLPDVQFPDPGQPPPSVDLAYQVNVTRAGQEIMAGGGAEFASGSSGIGPGANGGVAVLYDMNSNGTGPSNAVASITARYRKVPGTAGGL